MVKSLIGHGDDYAAQRAYRIIGLPSARLEILRFVLAFDEVSTAEIMQTLNMTRNGVLRHLEVLSSEGLIVNRRATHPRGAGPITYWRGDADEARGALEALTAHLFAK